MMVFTVVTMTVKSFAGNWVDIGPGADDGQVTWCRAGLGTNCAAGMGEQYEQPPVSSVPGPSPAVSPCPAGQLPGDQAATWLPHTRHRCAFTDLQVIAFSWL